MLEEQLVLLSSIVFPIYGDVHGHLAFSNGAIINYIHLLYLHVALLKS